jgi:hypothetical protein
MPPMEKITGAFVFDDGKVRMTDVGFEFRGAKAHFERGSVELGDGGRFTLGASYLEVDDFRLDKDLRRLMPPVMAQFALRLGDEHTFRFRTDLGIGWSGRPGEPAWCAWRDAKVILSGNTIQAGLPLEHLQGEVKDLQGWFDARGLSVKGQVDIESVDLLDQQLTRLVADLNVTTERAVLSHLRGQLLGGELLGHVEVDLADTPKYSANLELNGADLRRYTETIPGRQSLRGQVYARVGLSGMGSSLRTLQGQGEAHIVNGDLGELPIFLVLFKVIRLSPLTKTAFDRADAHFVIQDGETRIDPIQLTGNALSLHGRGTLSAQGELDLGLRVLLGRDTWHIRGLSDASREASGGLLLVRVQGTPSYPKIRPVPFEPISSAFRSVGGRLFGRPARREAPPGAVRWRNTSPGPPAPAGGPPGS